MNFKKIILCIMLSITLCADNLQAFIGETLFFGSIIACSFFNRQSQQSSLDAMVSKNIQDYQIKREIHRSLVNPSISDENRAAYEDLQTRSEQAYTNTLLQTLAELQSVGLYQNNRRIIQIAAERANQAHRQVHEEHQQNLRAQMAQMAQNQAQIAESQARIDQNQAQIQHERNYQNQIRHEMQHALINQYQFEHEQMNHSLQRNDLNHFEDQTPTLHQRRYQYSNESCRDDIRRKQLPRS